MDENAWLESADAAAMVSYVWNRIDARKQRLFACACVRSVWHNLRDERFRALVEISEEYADGRATGERLDRVAKALFEVTSRSTFSEVLAESPLSAMVAARGVGNRTASMCVAEALKYSQLSSAPGVRPGGAGTVLQFDPEAKATHARRVADLFRDIVGNPFRPVSLHPDWLAWDDGIVRRLAETMYEGRRYQELPILADALEEAGCDVPEVLEHLRGRGVHARGCWALDLARGA